MNVKAWLIRISHAPERIQSKQEELEELYALRESITVQLQPDRVQTSRTGNRTEKLTIKILELEAELKRDIMDFLDERNRAIQLIDNLEDPEQITVLDMRYIRGHNWHEVMERTGLSKTHMYRLHRQGLKELERVWH